MREKGATNGKTRVNKCKTNELGCLQVAGGGFSEVFVNVFPQRNADGGSAQRTEVSATLVARTNLRWRGVGGGRNAACWDSTDDAAKNGRTTNSGHGLSPPLLPPPLPLWPLA